MTPADSGRVAQTHLASFPGFFLSELGPGFLKLYYRVVCADQSGIALVAEGGNGCLTGFVAGTSNPRGFYSRLLKRRWLSFALAAMPAVLKKPAVIPRLLGALRHPGQSPEGGEVAGLYSIGVDPHAQQQGTGKMMLEEFLKEAKSRGCRKVFLTTDRDGNDRVNFFYLKNGFTLKKSFETAQGRAMNEYWKDI